MEQSEITARLSAAVAEGNEAEASNLAKQALAAGADPMRLIKNAIQPAMDQVGQRYERGEIYLPELIETGDAARAALDQIIPTLSGEDRSAAIAGTVVIGTMFGDNHDIGKNIVSAILAASGFKVVDLGINIPPRQFIESAKKEGANIIAMSTLITTSLPYQREIIQTLRDSGQRGNFFVVVGGGPVTPDWAKKIGADGYGREATDAAEVCLRLAHGDHKPPLGEMIVMGALKHKG
jgi:methylmalonyl-CoA mutase cobalamin-binding domain/chain